MQEPTGGVPVGSLYIGLHLVDGLLQIGNQIFGIFQTAGQTDQVGTNAGGFQQMTAPPAGGSDRKNTLLILGIVTIVFAFMFPLVSYICGIIGLVMASKAKKSGEDIGSGRTLCVIGLVLAVLNSIVGILVSVFVALSEFTDVFGTFISW